GVVVAHSKITPAGHLVEPGNPEVGETIVLRIGYQKAQTGTHAKVDIGNELHLQADDKFQPCGAQATEFLTGLAAWKKVGLVEVVAVVQAVIVQGLLETGKGNTPP